MNEFDLEDILVCFLLDSALFKNKEGFSEDFRFLSGAVYKSGTRNSIGNEDVIVEVLSTDDEQFQNAIVSIRTYVDDLNLGSPKLVPDISRLSEIAKRFEEIFLTLGSSYGLTTQKFRMRLDTIKRERKQDFNQHCVNCLFKVVICNF